MNLDWQTAEIFHKFVMFHIVTYFLFFANEMHCLIVTKQAKLYVFSLMTIGWSKQAQRAHWPFSEDTFLLGGACWQPESARLFV